MEGVGGADDIGAGEEAFEEVQSDLDRGSRRVFRSDAVGRSEIPDLRWRFGERMSRDDSAVE